jgi:hypothetical protein
MKIQRVRENQTLQTLSKIVGEPDWRLSLVEHGLDPGPELAWKIAQALDCAITDIFPVYEPSRFVKEYIEALK